MVSSQVVDDDVRIPGQRARWVVFACSGKRYGFPLEWVSEILSPRPFTRLPGAGPEVCGLIGVRGRAVTVLDLAVVLGRGGGAAHRADHRVLLLDLDERRVGVVVEEVAAIQAAEPDGTEAAEPWLQDAVLGVAAAEGYTFVALDPVRLIEGLLQGS